MLISFFFCLLKVSYYSPPLLVIKSVWQESSEVLRPSGHVAAAQAAPQTGLLAVMCYQAGDFKGLLQAYLKYHLGLPDGASHKVKVDQIPQHLAPP